MIGAFGAICERGGGARGCRGRQGRVGNGRLEEGYGIGNVKLDFGARGRREGL